MMIDKRDIVYARYIWKLTRANRYIILDKEAEIFLDYMYEILLEERLIKLAPWSNEFPRGEPRAIYIDREGERYIHCRRRWYRMIKIPDKDYFRISRRIVFLKFIGC